MVTLLNGDCLEQMKQLPDNSVDGIVTDPPYGISFMAKKWDYDVPSVEVWKEAMRVLKPGGHALIACGTRTQHRMVVNIEDAGFEIRDVVSWIYGSGFPKSLNISKAIDKAAGAKGHDSVGFNVAGKTGGLGRIQRPELRSDHPDYVKPTGITEAAQQWDGWGTALKPACEFFTLARKPLLEKTVAANVLKWGTGGINIDGCRVKANGENMGRFPANLIHDGSQQVLELFPESNKDSAARFFYCPKASKKDRKEGNNHPTVKPTALMQYLCRLITPTGGVVLDPYMGSGSTGKAAVKEGFSFVGCELDKDYYKIAKERIGNDNAVD